MHKDFNGSTPEPIVGKKKLVKMVARKTGISSTIVQMVLTAIIEVIGDVVRDGSFVIIKKLFSVRIKRRRAKRMYIPSKNYDGHYTIIPERSYISMKPSISLIKGIALGRGKGHSYIKKEDK